MKVGDRVTIYRNKSTRTCLSNTWIGLTGEIVSINQERDLSCRVRIMELGYHYDVFFPMSYLKREKK